jgi:hypothetical protein
LKWIVELGCLDKLIHVSMLSSFLLLPCEGCMAQAPHIFTYLKKYSRSNTTWRMNQAHKKYLYATGTLRGCIEDMKEQNPRRICTSTVLH